jgi:hypothetical protein
LQGSAGSGKQGQHSQQEDKSLHWSNSTASCIKRGMGE